MFGVTDNANSVMLKIRGFYSYFYFCKPPNLILQNEEMITQFTKAFNDCLHKVGRQSNSQSILKIEVCQRESLRDYKGSNASVTFVKVYCYQPNTVATIRNWMRNGVQVGGVQLPQQTFESNMPYALRFMIDKDIVGMGWIRIAGGQYKLESTN